jgi:hypothetical protein
LLPSLLASLPRTSPLRSQDDRRAEADVCSRLGDYFIRKADPTGGGRWEGESGSYFADLVYYQLRALRVCGLARRACKAICAMSETMHSCCIAPSERFSAPPMRMRECTCVCACVLFASQLTGLKDTLGSLRFIEKCAGHGAGSMEKLLRDFHDAQVWHTFAWGWRWWWWGKGVVECFLFLSPKSCVVVWLGPWAQCPIYLGQRCALCNALCFLTCPPPFHPRPPPIHKHPPLVMVCRRSFAP